MYIKKGDVYYIADVTSTFGETGNFTNGESISKTVNYTTAAPDVVWFKDIDGATLFNIAYSGGGYTNTSEELANVTVDAGIYEVIFNVVSKAGSGSNHRNEGVSVNDENVANLTGNVNGLRSLTITVASDGSTITAYGNGSSNYTDNLDYVLIKKVPATVTVDIKATGSTFSSAYPIDCDNLPAGVTAYKVTKMTASEVTATEVTGQVAAGTGLILKADAAETYDIPVANAGTAVEDNKLKAAVTATAVAADEAYGLKDGKFHKLKAGTISAGKAYLLASDITSAPDAPELTIVFGGATGISEIKTMRNAENEIFFDLQGRKVAQPTKGLYIVNGKKVVIK
jgi:hypothetical protein